MRYFNWLYRNHTFTSLQEINSALLRTIEHINRKPHSRFKVSRFDRWEKTEKAALQGLPTESYEFVVWKEAVVHADSHIGVDHCFYSVPYIHRRKTVKVKVTEKFVEIFLDFERVAIHKRYRSKDGARRSKDEHLPPNARAYREATPQNVLGQAKHLNPELYGLIDELFEVDTIGHLRRALGLVRHARKEISALGSERGGEVIRKAIEAMKLYNKIRVPYFRELLNRYRLETNNKTPDRRINRNSNNPMLRYTSAQSELILH